MANGLRKLIRNSRRFSAPSLTRRLQPKHFGPRLKVEELEERIAPAAVTLAPGEFAVWDVGANNGTHEATDGIVALGSTSTVDSITVQDIAEGGEVLNITVTDTDGAGPETIILATNQAWADINISGLDAGTTSLTLVIASGVDFADADAGAGDDVSFTINGVTYSATTLDAAESTTAHGNADTYTGLTNAGIGNTDVGGTDFTTLAVDLTMATAGTGDVGSLDFSDTVDDDGASLNIVEIDASEDAANTVGAITVGGNLTGANVLANLSGAVAVDQITGPVVITGSTAGAADITAATGITADGDITITGDMAGDIVTTAGAIAGDIDVTGTITGAITGDDGISGAITADTIAGAITVTDGNFSGSIATTAAVGTGNIGNVTVDTGGTGSFTSTASIDSAGTLGTLLVGGDIAGDVTTVGTVAAITTEDGSVTSDSTIIAGGTITALNVDVDGDGTGNVAGSVSTANGDITTIDVGGDVTGTIAADDNIGGNITIDGSIGANGLVSAGGNITGGAVTIGAGIASGGALQAGGNIGSAVTITTGGLAGTIRADSDGNGAGDIDAAVTVTAGGISGAVRGWNIDANVTASAGDITGPITADNDLTGGVIATLGDIDGATITVGNDFSGTIEATAGSIEGTTQILINNDASGDITAQTNVTPQLLQVGNDFSGTITATDGDISGVTVIGNLVGNAGDATDIEAGGDITLTAGGIVTANQLFIGADDDLTLTVNGPITANDAVVFQADVDGSGAGNITSIASTGAWTIAGGSIAISGEQVTSVTSGAALAFTTITAATTVGTIQSTDAAITGNITALDGGVTLVDAGSGDYAGTISQTDVFGTTLLNVIENDVRYTVETSAADATEALFDVTYVSPGGGATPGATVVMDVVSGNGYDISLETNNEDGTVNDATFDLTAFSFVAGTTAAERALGVVNVEGDINGLTLSSGVTLGSVDALIAQGDITLATLQLSSINVLAAGLIGGADPTEANVDALTTALAGADPTGTAANGAYTIPLQQAGGNDVEIFFLAADGDFAEANLQTIAIGAANDAEAVVTFTAGVVTDVSGTGGDITIPDVPAGGMDLSGFAGDITITGDVAGQLTLGDPASLTIGGDVNAAIIPVADPGGVIGDGDGLIDIAGDLDITGDVNVALTFDTIGIDLLAGAINADLTTGDVGDDVIVADVVANLTVGDVADDFTTGDVSGTIVAGDIGGDVSLGDLTGTASFDDITGTTTVDSIGDTGAFTAEDLGGNMLVDDDADPTNASSAMNGSILLTAEAGASESIHIDGDMGSFIGVIGGLVNVTATGDLGVTGGGSVIAATDGIATIRSDTGDVNANIFTGGAAGQVMTIEATLGDVTGAFAVGQRVGVSSLTVTTDTDSDVFTTTGGQAAFSAAAGNFNGATDVVDLVVMLSDDDLDVINNNGDGADLTDVLMGDDWSSDITTNDSITGTIVVSDEIDIDGVMGGDDTDVFQALAAGLTDAVEVANAATLAAALEAFNDSALQLSFGDDAAPVDFTGDIEAFAIGGLLVGGDIGTAVVPTAITAEDSVGYIASLDGSINAVVNADTSLGSIVASGDIEGTYDVEGPIATAALPGGDEIRADLLEFLGSTAGVPAGFENGVLTEIGNVEATFRAQGTTFGPFGVATDDGMGTIFAPAGNVDIDLVVNGNWGGVVTFGELDGDITVIGNVDQIIAGSRAATLNLNVTGSIGEEIDPGDILVTPGMPFSAENVSVTIVGDARAFVTYTGGDTIDRIVITGLDAGEEVNITGDVEVITVQGDWGGEINVSGSALDETDGDVDTINVNGDILFSADLTADTFDELLVTGAIAPNLTDSGTLTADDRTDPVDYDGATVGTLYLRGSRRAEADWEAVFGKVTSVDITGRGGASFAAAEGVVAEGDFRDFLRTGQLDADNDGLDVGEIETDATVKLRQVAVEGSLDSVGQRSDVFRSVWVSDDADSITARRINNLFVDGDAGNVTVTSLNNAFIDGDVDEMNVFRARNTTVTGLTTQLNLTGSSFEGARGAVINGLFQEGVVFTNFTGASRFVQLRNTAGVL